MAHILIVDDEPQIRLIFLLQYYLKWLIIIFTGR